tara:strand:- start:548 stop:835 length:288 start_codon:yes stop_codon:yes gene_type:complete
MIIRMKNFMNWTVYMVKCNDNSIYTGISNDLKKRLENHAKGKGSKYIRTRLPFKLIYEEECQSRSNALKREIEIKKLTKKNKELLAQLNNKKKEP